MSLPPLTLTRRLLPLGLVFLAAGLSLALVGPFLALFLSTSVDAGPVKVTVFLVVGPLAGVATSWAIGRVSDRRPMRRHLLIIASIAGVIGCGLAAVIRDYWALLALTTTAFAVAGALFPQTFAYAREVLQRDDPGRAALGISALRTVFSLAYVGGPPIAALLLSHGGFTAVFATAAVMYALATLVAFGWLSEVEAPAAPEGDQPPPVPAPAASRIRIWLTVAAFTLMQAPMVLGVQALALFIEHDLHGSVGDAGLILGLCAALEIPLMLGLGLLTRRISVRALILAGSACGVIYSAIVFGAPAVWVLLAAQIVNALYIASVSSLGITYVQDMMPAEPGRATTLFTNTFPIGQIMAGPLLGLAQHTDYRWAYAMNFVMCLLGVLLLLATRPAARVSTLRLRRARASGADVPAGDRRPA
ncbi:sugar efflux transporter [Actinoplanes sp. NPDC051343]|uniref:sugar efflux transporter n=1 Tax=Actinoplanes sp. NPDC051343 TaxID=3363906 RepID=UPI003794D313